MPWSRTDEPRRRRRRPRRVTSIGLPVAVLDGVRQEVDDHLLEAQRVPAAVGVLRQLERQPRSPSAPARPRTAPTTSCTSSTRSTSSRCSAKRPTAMRETSSRLLISRSRRRTCRSASVDALVHARGLERIGDRRRHARRALHAQLERGQRRLELVRRHREELVAHADGLERLVLPVAAGRRACC